MRIQTSLILTLLFIPAAALGQQNLHAPSIPSDPPRCGDGVAMPSPAPLREGAALHGEIGGALPPVPIPNACEPPPGTAGPAVLSIRNMGEPLYVIDGVPGPSESFNSLSAEIIESISVLKDGAADEFGEAGRNGVVVVRTRRSESGVDDTPAP